MKQHRPKTRAPHGSAAVTGPTKKERAALPDRFWSRVRQDGQCWLWTGSTHHFGHGAFWWEGKTRRAHRVAWTAIKGDPGTLDVLHRCDRPGCVRPKHLFLGDQAANNADKTAKGRQYRPIGDLHHRRILGSTDVRAVRQLLADGFRGSVIADVFGVHRNTIYAIDSRRNWSSVC